MKKQLLSILALILCFCTVLVFASCAKRNVNDENDSSSDESLSDSSNILEELEEEIKDVDATTAEDIFAAMKSAYKATLEHKGAYSVDINWTENQNDSETGKGASAASYKYVSKETHTADPTAAKSSSTYANEEYEDGKLISSTTQNNKVYNEGGKTCVFSSTVIDGQNAGNTYNTLSSYGLAAQKDAMLLSSFLGGKDDFEECFGDPFSASSASDLKSVHTAVINEIKANQKAQFEAEGYTVKQITASANIILNKTSDTHILKRTVTVAINLQNDGGNYQKNLTVEGLLKVKNGKILSFASTSSLSTVEKLGDGYNYQTSATSSLTYEFSYAINNTQYDAIKTSTPASITNAPDYFEVPVTFVINGNEVPVMIIGETDEATSVSSILEKTINDHFADAKVEYDGKWYTDANCTKQLDISTINTIDKLKNIGKLYNSSFAANGTVAVFIDSGKATLNIPKNYTIVFGNTLSEAILNTSVSITELGDENVTRISYMPDNGHTETISINGTALTAEDFLEDSDGSFFHEFIFEGGKIYFIKRSNVTTKTFYTLDNFYVNF